MQKWNSVSVKWCCGMFEGMYENAGGRGASVLIGRDMEGWPEFTIQHRAIDRDDQSDKVPLMSEPILMTIVTEFRITYCPGCGRNLSRWYKKNIDILARPELRM